MRSPRSRIATRVSLLFTACAIAVACAHKDVPLQPGSVTCGTATCADGELCVVQDREGSGDRPPDDYYYSCVAAPAHCSFAACTNNKACNSTCCEPCIDDLCDGWPLVEFDGKTLTCTIVLI
jgi:hypothetical protein